MLSKLFQFEAFYQLKQRAFFLLALVFFFMGAFIGQQGFAPKGVDFNAGYQVYFYTIFFSLSAVFGIMFFAITAMLRDRQYGMDGLIFSTAIKKPAYFWTRFLGTFVFSVLAFSPFLLGYIFGNYFLGLDPERIADFSLMTYLQPWLYIVVPNIFICSALIFSVSTLSQNTIATYVGAIFIYMLYFVCSIYLNSPLLARSVPASPESMAVAAVIDPFGAAAFFEQTQYWTPYQKNNELLSFSGLFMANRLVWAGFSILVLLLSYSLFSFRKLTKRVKNTKEAVLEERDKEVYKPILARTGVWAQWIAYIALVRLELRSVFKGLPFLAVLLMWLFIVFSNLSSTVLVGGEYGVSLYPFTSELMDLIMEPILFFSLILIVFYSAEIVWRERAVQFNYIIDSTPIKNSSLFLSKLTALLLLPFILISTGIAMCILCQLVLGYSNFEFGLYASLYYYSGFELVFFCLIALFIHSFSKTKFMGMGLVVLVIALVLKSDLLGLEHPLTSPAFLPQISYSNMNGFIGGVSKFKHLSIYWLVLGLGLTLVSFKIWDRGLVNSFASKLRQLGSNWSLGQRAAGAVLVLMFVGSGGLVYYNTNIVSDYFTKENILDLKAQYEKQYKDYEDLERLTIISRKTEVDIYPKERKYTVEGTYLLENKNDMPVHQVLISERLALDNISIDGGVLIEQDSNLGIYLFEFDNPIANGDSVNFQFKLDYTLKGYEDSRVIVDNGSYITHRDFEPILGYSSIFEIKSNKEREKYELAPLEKETDTDEHIKVWTSKMEKTPFETIVSTQKGQIALSSGDLLRSWTRDGRSFSHYLSSKPISPMIAYFSADYQVDSIEHNGVSIEQYYHKDHAFNVDLIEESAKATLDYCKENFGAYAFEHARIAEIPGHWGFGGFAHPGVMSMVEHRLYLTDVRDENTFNLVAKRTIHEISHQWWGHALTTKPVAGASLLIEGLAKYTEAVILEKIYGKGFIYDLVEDARLKYFQHRALASEAEPPVYKVLGQNYISYGKSLHVMLALRDLIGEDKVNKVLKNLTDRFRGSAQLEVTSLDFLAEVYEQTPKYQHRLVDDWFKKVITYDLSVDESSTSRALADGRYEISLVVNASRMETMETGEAIPVDIAEPIKVGVFSSHPSLVRDESSVLHFESVFIDKEKSEVKIIVNEKPAFVAVDPYGTRSDENLTDNLMKL